MVTVEAPPMMNMGLMAPRPKYSCRDLVSL